MLRPSLLLCAAPLVCACRAKPAAVHDAARPAHTALATLSSPRRASHAWGRAGDTVLRVERASLTLASTPDLAGHRPLRGAVVDLHPDGSDLPDPLLWWRPAWIDADAHAHPLVARAVAPVRCDDGSQGVEVTGAADAIQITERVCGEGSDGFVLRTRAVGLRAGERLGDEVNPGSASVVLDAQGEKWEGSFPSRALVIAEHGVVLVMTAHAGALPEARRRFVHIATETFPSAVTWSVVGDEFTRHVRVLRGDVFDGLSAATARPRVIDVVATAPGELELCARDGAVLATGRMGELRRRLLLPEDFGVTLRTRDARGVASAPIELPAHTTMAATVRATLPPVGLVRVSLDDGEGQPTPAHVLLRGLDATPDPTLGLTNSEAGFSAGRSVYLLEGAARLTLPVGRYRLTASRGPAYTLVTQDLAVVADAERSVRGSLRRVIGDDTLVAGDFHLHSAPSPDSIVTLEQRVASLVCNGVEVAAATDHNRITDFGPAVTAQRLSARITVIAGDEVTSAGGRLWGHFIGIPLPVPARDDAPDDRVPGYYNQTPEEMFRATRAMGARVVMVNHPRMPPSIGYFDLTRLDPATGAAAEGYSDDFDAVEVFNGIWLQTPERVREGLRDVVAVARRGHRVSAVGNSDSHQLLYEEAGYPRTYVRVAPGPRGTLGRRTIDAVRAGRTYVTSGPLVELTVGTQGPGETVTARGATVQVHVRVSAPAWVPVERVQVWTDDTVTREIAVTATGDGVRYEGDVTVPLGADAMLTAWAEATRPLPDVMPYADARAIGFSGPLWVDHDGDGRVRVPPRR